MTEALVTFETAKIARLKGFNEKCIHAWEFYIYNGKTYGPTELPLPDGYQLENIIRIPTDLRKELLHTPGLFANGPMNNYMYPPWIFARPSQDVLEDWLRLEYGIHTYAKIIPGSRVDGIPPLYVAGVYSTLFDDCEKWQDDKAFPERRFAREESLKYGMNLLI